MKKEKKTKKIKNRRWFLAPFKCILRPFIKRPKIVYLGEKIEPQSMILSNHKGASGPLSLELYFKEQPFRFLGTYEMNGGLRSVYTYLSKTYYHQKKHWNLTLSRIFCLIAAPLTNMFYKGLNLISTYPDARCKITIKEAMKTIDEGQSLIIFPEDSSNGYYDELTKFFSGFVLLGSKLYQKGIDISIYPTYLNKKERLFVVGEKVKYSELISTGETKEQIAERMRNVVNGLGKYKPEEK